MYQYVLFDLDGTLTDPGLGITNSIMYALKKFGIIETDRAALYKFIGPPLRESFSRFYGFSEKDSELATAYYREYFKDRGLYENAVYDGVEALLETLHNAGKHIILATSKPEEFAVEILRYFKLGQYFTLIAGATMDTTRNKKSDVIAYAIEKSGIADLSKAVMIGDREHDILGAKENHLSSIGVLYGYGDRAELEAAGADHIVGSPGEILSIV